MRVRHVVPLVPLAVLVLAVPAMAQPSDPARAVSELAARARTSGDLFAFLAAVGRLGDVDLGRTALAPALAGAMGPVKDLLGSTNRLTVRNGRVELQRDGETRAALPGSGHLAARARVSYEVDADGRLVNVSGLDVGPRAAALRPVRRVDLDRDASGTVARVTAGTDDTAATARLRVSPELASGALAEERRAVSTRGLRGVLDDEPPGTFDLSRYTMASKRYKRRAGSRRADVGVRTLPAIQVDGRTSRPVGFDSGMAIDADGAGDAHRGDGSGQASTSLAWSHRPGRERYLDPTVTPFVALPIGFERDHPGVRLGDIVAVQYDGKTAYAIYGDRGPRDQLGEGSIALGKALGLTSRQLDPNRGGVETGVTYVVFPGSGTGRPLENAEIQARGERLHRAALAAMR